jgi:hypothetical protein
LVLARAAGGLDEIVELLDATTLERLLPRVAPRDDTHWRRYYESDLAWLEDLSEAIGHGAIDQVAGWLWSGDTAAKPLPNEPELDERRLLASPAFAFLLRVALPCLVRMSRTPCQLLADATASELPDIERLAEVTRLDLLLVQNPLVAGAFASAPEGANLLRELMRESTARRRAISRSKLARSLASFASAYAEWAGSAMTCPTIREPFDEAARRSDQGRLIESSLPASPEALTKAIQRGRVGWRAFFARLDKTAA